MKRILLGVAAAALLGVAPANAQNYGNDAVSWINLDAAAVSFCALTATEEGTQVHADINGNATSGAGYHFSDARISFDLQTFATDDGDSSNETVQSANRIADGRAVLRFPGSQCNSNFTITANSLNGGMLNDDWTPAQFDDNFTNLIGYNVRVTFDDTVDENGDAAPGDFITGGPTYGPEFGLFRIAVRVDGDNKRMLVGSYDDFLVVSMVPQI